METTLFAVINVETPVIVAESSAESRAELVTLDDAKLRQVSGGSAIVMMY
jgi:hypothetical protein